MIGYVNYRIAGKFGEEFNLMNWRRQTQIANLKTHFLNAVFVYAYTNDAV